MTRALNLFLIMKAVQAEINYTLSVIQELVTGHRIGMLYFVINYMLLKYGIPH